jgi:hypothetical protein
MEETHQTTSLEPAPYQPDPLAEFARSFCSAVNATSPCSGEQLLLPAVQLILSSTAQLQQAQHKKHCGNKQLQVELPGFSTPTQHEVRSKLPCDVDWILGSSSSSSSSNSSSSVPYLSYSGFKGNNFLGSKLCQDDFPRFQLQDGTADGTAAVLKFNYSIISDSAIKSPPAAVPGMPGVYYLGKPADCSLELQDTKAAAAAAAALKAAKQTGDSDAKAAAEAAAKAAVLWEGSLQVRMLAVFLASPLTGTAQLQTPYWVWKQHLGLWQACTALFVPTGRVIPPKNDRKGPAHHLGQLLQLLKG